MPYDANGFRLIGTVFSKVEKEKVSGKNYEKVMSVIGELAPFDISMGCTASKIAIPIPSTPAIRIRMGFQGPTLHMVVNLHTYDMWKEDVDIAKLRCTNDYEAWKYNIDVEDLIKVSTTGDVVEPVGFGTAVAMDCTMAAGVPTGWSVMPLLKPGTYWYVRKKEIMRDAGFMDKFRMELDLERSWQWSTSGRQRPAYDVDEMGCFKNGITGYQGLTTEYASV